MSLLFRSESSFPCFSRAADVIRTYRILSWGRKHLENEEAISRAKEVSGQTSREIRERAELLPEHSAQSMATTSTTVTNPLTGKLHTENHGDVTVRNVKSGDTCVLKFHQAGYFSREVPRKVTGVVYDSLGNSKFLIEAVWDKYVEIYRVTSDKLDTEYCDTDGGRRIWCANELPADADKMHNFTQFAIELNEPEEGVAPSDSRRRPDQRLMEEGHWDEANAVKQRLEELQRRRKGAFEKSHPGEKYSPRWFRVRDEDTMTDRNDVYEYTNEYWQSKKEGNWGDSMAIFDL